MIADPQSAKTETNVFTTSNTGVISIMLCLHRNSRCNCSLPPASGRQCRVGGLAIHRQVDSSSRDMEDSTTREVEAISSRVITISSSINVEVISSSSRDSRNKGAETTADPGTLLHLGVDISTTVCRAGSVC